jgi:hypothetical protein
MGSKEGQPALGRSGSLGAFFHPTGDGSLGKIKTDHAEFRMDPRRSPGGVLNLRPDSGDQPPAHTKTDPVPADDGFGRNDDEGLLPSRPDLPGNYPEELIEQTKARSRMSGFQYSELLPEHEILQNKIPALMEEANQGSDPDKNRQNVARSYTR